MPESKEYMIEYILTQVRFVRVWADTVDEAMKEVVNNHDIYSSDRVKESVVIMSAVEDN